MYLYLGQNTLVPKKSVVGVFDMDNATSSHVTISQYVGKKRHDCKCIGRHSKIVCNLYRQR